MEREKKEIFRQLLLDQLRKLEEEAHETLHSLHRQGNLETADPIDAAEEEHNRGFTLRLRDREQKLRKKILRALEKLEDGTYGICEVCGEPIEEKRLLSRPVATLCIDCKEEQEIQEQAEQKG
jgi:DnaK suppressor protein